MGKTKFSGGVGKKLESFSSGSRKYDEMETLVIKIISQFFLTNFLQNSIIN